jgi:solute carrier family 27 fatty acid transporter 1/4
MSRLHCSNSESHQQQPIPQTSAQYLKRKMNNSTSKSNGISPSSPLNIDSPKDLKSQNQYAGVPQLLVEASFALFLMIFFVQRQHWIWLALSFIVFRFFYSELGRRCLRSFPRDMKGLFILFTVKHMIRKALKRNVPLHQYFLDHVEKHPNKDCVIDIETGRKYSFKEFNNLCNKYANYFKSQGYKKDDVVALFIENSPEFIALWVGLSKIGVITAWINSNLKLEPLAHCINVAKVKCTITSPSLLPTLKSTISAELLDKNMKIYLTDGNESDYTALAKVIKDESEPPVPAGLDFKSNLCYIYTSGTTGNPKPAVIKHLRYYWIANGSGVAFGIKNEDVFYVTLPVYHSQAGILGVGQAIVRGSTLVIRKKFSASNFWKDCGKYKCTASQYIGEICRYLLAQKPCPEERLHNIRVMFGNGLRGEIWPDFVSRFGIKKIGELYGSTEGNSNILNIDGHIGACGFFPIYPFLTSLYPVRLVKVDPETNEIIRDKNGLCISCRPGSYGEMVGMIKENDPLLRFEGYVDAGDTAKKLIRDVCKKGDCVFTSGDILYWDPLGYLYFKDRRGDTYRWKGENVSTMEVEGILQPLMSIEDASVFGVEIKGREGRAGMIGVVLAENANIEEFIREASARLSDNLAPYAIPIFLRICNELEKTGTFKLKKTALQKDGFDLKKCNGDKIYFWESSEKQYKIMDEKMQDDIESGIYSKI